MVTSPTHSTLSPSNGRASDSTVDVSTLAVAGERWFRSTENRSRQASVIEVSPGSAVMVTFVVVVDPLSHMRSRTVLSPAFHGSVR